MVRDSIQRSAFTLVEILIVVTILGITALLAVPMIGDRSDLNLSAASRKILADLTYCQNMAISTQSGYFVRFNTNKYEVCSGSATTMSTIAHPVEKLPFIVLFGSSAAGSPLASTTLDRPSFNGVATLGFDSLGTPQSVNEGTGATTTLTAQQTLTIRSGGQSVNIRIEPYTGEISID